MFNALFYAIQYNTFMINKTTWMKLKLERGTENREELLLLTNSVHTEFSSLRPALYIRKSLVASVTFIASFA